MNHEVGSERELARRLGSHGDGGVVGGPQESVITLHSG